MVITAKRIALPLAFTAILVCPFMLRLAIAVDTLEAPMVKNAPVIDGTVDENEWKPAVMTEVTPNTCTRIVQKA